MSLSRATLLSRRLPGIVYQQSAMFGSNPKDGGAGAVREAGGAFAKREAAQEDQYFRQLQSEQLKNLKSHVDEEIKHHKDEVKRHQEQIQRLQEKASELGK